MNNADKQIAIAEMLGWRKGHKDFPKEQRWKDDWFDNNEIRHTHLHFDSDANWQFDAIDWIENLHDSNWFYEILMIEHNNISIRARNKKDGSTDFEWLSVFEKGYHNWTRKETIFEALFQFSQ